MLGNETIRILARTVRNADGTVTVHAVDVDVPGCWVGPLTTEERPGRGVDGDDAVLRVGLPITSGLGRDATLVVRGKRYRVLGEPEPYIDEDPELNGYDITVYRKLG